MTTLIRCAMTAFNIMAIAINTAAASEEIAVIQQFSEDPSLSAWSPLNRATIDADQGKMTLIQPKYEGGPEQWPRAERDVTQWDFSAFNGIEVTVENPNESTQELDLLARDGRGGESYMSAAIEPRAGQTVRLRFADAYNSVDWSDIRQLVIMRTTPDVTYIWHVRKIALFRDAPDETPRYGAEQALARAATAMKDGGSLLNEPSRRSMNQAITAWRDRLKKPDGLRGELLRCKTELAALAASARRIKAEADARAQTDASLLAWSVAPGQAFRPSEAMLQYDQPASLLSIVAAQGEYGDALLRLTNVGAVNQDLRVTVKPPESTGNDAKFIPPLSIRRNVPVLARDGTLCGDALAPLDPSGVVSLPAGETVELWLRADVRHAQWPPGMHRFILEARDLRKADAPVTALPVEVRILDIDLAAAQPMRAHFWPEFSHARSWIVHGREKIARDNLVDYGANVVTLVGSDLPWPKLNPDGGIESIDFSKHDEVVTFHRGTGSPMLLFWMEMDTGNEDQWGLRAGLKPGSPEWKRALAGWLSAWSEHLGRMGLTPEDYAFYVTDEPNREELDRTELFASVAKSVNPRLQIYVNGSRDLWDEDSRNDRLMELVDVWQPDESGQSKKLLDALARHEHVERWIYRCSMSRRSYDVNAHDYYRLMTWRALRDGVKGIAYWTYCATHPGEDPWDGTKGTASGAILVYPDSAGGLIMSVRWELVRMALDDARYADLLRKATPGDEGQRKAIHSLLNDRLNEVIQNPERPELVAQWRVDAGTLLESLSDH